MIQNLKKKFILTNMLLVSLVLSAVFTIQITSGYQRSVGQTRAALHAALRWHPGEAPERFHIRAEEEEPPPPSIEELDGELEKDPFARGFYLPVFVARVDSEGIVTDLNNGLHVEITQESAQALVTQVLDSGKSEGILPVQNLRFLVLPQEEEQQTCIAFADRSLEQDSLWNLVRNAIIVAALALAGFFVISLFLSRIVVKPVETAWEQQRRFVADASHELKTPLTVILANTDILLSHPEETIQTKRKWLEYTQTEALRMKALVENLLLLAKNDAAKQPLPTTELDFSELVLSSCLTFETVAFEAGLTLETDLTAGLTVAGNPELLRRLCGVLLDNACKFADSGSVIRVALAQEAHHARLCVENTGVPIPAEHLPHLFDRFYRADNARSRQAGGYGLGLSIAKSVVDAHKGTIQVSSTERKTCFTVLLPLS